ncbi:hypothetical protein FACS1894219_09230 [Clostridia bacterium]|nr:hypothetical protein FACS1894219_09230 [Clostridia bacterium]
MVCAVAVFVLYFVPGINLLGTTGSYAGGTYLTNPVQTLSAVNEEGHYQKFEFDKKHSNLLSPTSHVQGFAKYTTNENNFNIFTYSNVNGRHGYVYIVSDETDSNGKAKYQFTLEVPDPEIQRKDIAPNADGLNPHFNHPCGLQIYGDYAIIPVIPYHSAAVDFYDSTAVFYSSADSRSRADCSNCMPTYRRIIPSKNIGLSACFHLYQA